jgi:hypothetical protein
VLLLQPERQRATQALLQRSGSAAAAAALAPHASTSST